MRTDRRPARIRALLLFIIGLLYVVSIPWYRTPSGDPAIWLGLPDWVAVALGCYVGVAVLNFFAWLLTEIPDPPPESREDP